MSARVWLQCCLFYLLSVAPSLQALEIHAFDTPQQEQLYQRLIHELRCVVCQNQNLAESNAPLALDLRQRIYEKIQAGQDQQQITQFMVERYGDFVLYQPPFQWNTILLWLAPLAFLIVGLLLLKRLMQPMAAMTDANDGDGIYASTEQDGANPPPLDHKEKT